MRLLVIYLIFLIFFYLNSNTINCISLYEDKIISFSHNIENINNDLKARNDLPSFLKKNKNNDSKYEITINSINTNINIDKNIYSAIVLESVNLTLNNGLYDTFIHIIPLSGSSSGFHNFTITSNDVELINSRIINSCYEDEINNDAYICVISTFKPINITSLKKSVEFLYEYSAESVIKKRIRPFSNIEDKMIVWIYDNTKKYHIEKIKLTINLPNTIDKYSCYPEKYYLTNNTIEWEERIINKNDYMNYVINIPIIEELPGYKDNNYIFTIIDNFITTISLFITLIIMLYSYIRKLYIFKDKQNTIK